MGRRRLGPARTAHERGDYAAEVALCPPLAEKGFAFAQFNLGVLYDNGQGLPQDDAQAIAWYRKAAEQGLPQAQVNLGIMRTSRVRACRRTKWRHTSGTRWLTPRATVRHRKPSGTSPKDERGPRSREAERRAKEFKASHSFTVPPIPEIVPETRHGNG